MNTRLDEITFSEILSDQSLGHDKNQLPILMIMVLGTTGSVILAYLLTGSLDAALLGAYACFALTAWHAGRHAAWNRKALIIELMRLQLHQMPEGSKRRAIAQHLEPIASVHRAEYDIEVRALPGMLVVLALMQGIILFDTPANIALRAVSAVSMLLLYVLAFRVARERIRFQKRVRRLRNNAVGVAA